ncbi:YchE family NAAT transporter [Microbacterium awajiense]|uniref:UPF0056 membrane protein n=1 Tax=Microbacterium awajiense TaxID=415214 RepID=A0ABP7AZX7_9MICO
MITEPTLITMGIALFTLTNPIGTSPVFLALTQSKTVKQQRHIALIAGLGVFVVLLASLLIGTYVLAWFDIDVTSFKIAGFAFVAMIAWGMLTKQGSPVAATDGSPAIVPLAFPVLAGPGAIALMVSFSHDHSTLEDYAWGVAIVAIVAILTTVVLYLAPLLMKVLGEQGMSVFTKVFGLILLAICVQAVLSALITAFPVLGG